MTNANRTNKFAGSKQKKKYTNLVAWECKVQKLKPLKKKINVEFCGDARIKGEIKTTSWQVRSTYLMDFK